MKHEPIAAGSNARENAYRLAADRGSDTELAATVRRFMPLVQRSAWHFHREGRHGLELEDLVQVGTLALTQAARRHAMPVPDGFAAYAKMRVRGAMMDEMRRADCRSRTARANHARWERTRLRLAGELGREPDRSEIAAALGLDGHALTALEQCDISLTPLDEAYDEHSAAFASDDPDPFDILSASDDRERLIRAMSDLPERLQLVLQLFFVEELNLTEIAAVLEVSVPRVHQLRAKALRDLRRLLDEDAD